MKLDESLALCVFSAWRNINTMPRNASEYI